MSAAVAMLVLGAVQGVASLQAGGAARGQAEQQAEAMEIKGIADEAQAFQNMSIRIGEYEKAFQSNDAIFSFLSGGGENIGVQKAFYDVQGSERQVLVKDVATLSQGLSLQKGQVKLASMVEIERGKQAQRAAMFDALGSFVGGYANYQKYNADTAGAAAGAQGN